MSEKNNKTRAATVRLRLKPAEQADWIADSLADDVGEQEHGVFPGGRDQ